MKLTYAVIAASFMTFASFAYAGPGHDHGEGAFAESSGEMKPFVLLQDVISDLKIQSKPMEKRVIAQAISMPFSIIPVADKTIEVYPQFPSGQVRDILVSPGQTVKKDQPLLRATVLSGLMQSATIYAPISGKVSALGISPGQRITDDTFIATISNPGGVMAKGELPEGFAINLIKNGDDVSLLVDTYDQKYITGKVLNVDRVLHPDARTYAVYVSLDDEDHTELLRHTGQMTVWAQKSSQAVNVVPSSAVFGERGSEFVFIQYPCGTFEYHPVKTGRRNGLFVEVGGLHDGENIVFSGGYLLQFVRGGTVDSDHDHDKDDQVNSAAHDHGDHDHDHEHSEDEHNGKECDHAH